MLGLELAQQRKLVAAKGHNLSLRSETYVTKAEN